MPILIFLVYLTWFTYPFQLFAIGGTYGFTLVDVNMILIFFVFLKKVIWDGVELKIPFSSVAFFILLLIFAAIISGINPLFSGNKILMNQYIKTSLHFYYLVFYGVICLVYPIEGKIWTRVIKMWLILGFFINIFGIYQIVARTYDLPLAWLDFTNISLNARGVSEELEVRQLSVSYGDFYRATSIFSEPSSLAGFNTNLFIFLFIPFIQGCKPFFKSKILISLIFASTIAGSFLTFSLTGFVSIMMVIVCAFIFQWSKKLLSSLKFIVLSVLVIIITDYFVSDYSGISVAELFQKRLSGAFSLDKDTEYMYGETIEVRQLSGYLTYKVWEEYPLTGIGIGLTAYNRKYEVKFSDFGFLAVLAEMGILGIISLTGMYAAVFYFGYLFIRRKKEFPELSEEDKRLAGLIFYIMLVMVQINYISGNNLIISNFWVPFGIVLSILNNSLLKINYKVHNISLVNNPIRDSFRNIINTYLEKNKKRKKS